MKNNIKLQAISALLIMLAAPAFAKDSHDLEHDDHPNRLPNMFSAENSHGKDATYSTAGFIDLNNPFFKSIGTNGRSCASCHAPDQGWTITPQEVKKLFNKTKGLDPLFRLVDGANSPPRGCNYGYKTPRGLQHAAGKSQYSRGNRYSQRRGI